MTNLTRRTITVLMGLLLALGPATLAVRGATGPENDAYVMNEDTTLVIDAPGVLENDHADSGEVCVTGIDAEGAMGWLHDQGNTGWKSDGSFEFTPYDGWNGTTSFIYGMHTLDAGGQCIGEADGQATVTITVRPVNDPPTGVVAATCDRTVTVDQDSGPFNDPDHCAEAHNWGPIDENTQIVDEWVVSNDAPELFTEQPALDVVEITYGALHFEPAPGAHGTATVTVKVRDTGGTANGGDDLSAPVTFKITIRALGSETGEPPAEVSPSPDAATEAPSAAASDAPSAASTDSPDGSPTGAPTGTAPWTVLFVGIVVLALIAGLTVPRLLRRKA